MVSERLDVVRARKGFVWVARVVSYVIYFYLIVVEIILIIGFFLLLFGANPSAGFTQWAYRNLDRVMEPFRGIFTPIQLGTTSGNVQAVFDTSVVFAMIVYGILALLLSCRNGCGTSTRSKRAPSSVSARSRWRLRCGQHPRRQVRRPTRRHRARRPSDLACHTGWNGTGDAGLVLQ
jgi:hypothetical protein